MAYQQEAKEYLCDSYITIVEDDRNVKTLDRVYVNCYATDAMALAEVSTQYFYLKDAASIALHRVTEIHKQRFGIESLQEGFKAAQRKLEENSEIVEALTCSLGMTWIDVREEQETVIRASAANREWNFFTWDPKFARRLEKLGYAPVKGQQGGWSCRIALDRIAIRKPEKRKLSTTQRGNVVKAQSARKS